jgi:hypothetical protein
MVNLKKESNSIWENEGVQEKIIEFALDELGKWLNPPPVGTNSDKIPKKQSPLSGTNIANIFNSQNNSYNYTQSVTTNTNIFNTTNNSTVNITIPPLPSRNLPQTLTTGGSSNTRLVVKNTVKKSLANRKYGTLLTSPYYDAGETILFFNDVSESDFLDKIEESINKFVPTAITDKSPDAIKNSVAFISVNDRGNAVPVPNINILNEISTFYGGRSKTAGFEVTGLINIGGITVLTEVGINNSANYPDLVTDFSNGSNSLKIWDLLGYEETEFKEKSIELIIKEFREKIYDSTDNGRLLEIGDNFETTEQFIAGAIATLFYREGLSKFPIEIDLPDNKKQIFTNSFEYLKYLIESGEAIKIWEALGYEETDFKQKNMEEVIKDFGKKIYLDQPLTNIDDNVLSDIGNNFQTLPQLLLGIGASLFYRQGLHRLPGQVPESLTLDKKKYPKPEDQPTIFIEDAIEYQEYLLKNLDAIFGQFPINFKVKLENDQGQPEEKEVNFPNISETLTEIIGTLIGVSKDSDTAVAIGIKNLIETAKCSNLALTAVDTARANAEYLGYKSKDIERTVLVPFNPNAKSLKDFLKDTELKITSFDNIDDDTLESQLKLLSVAAQITKSALAQRKTFITGDGIKERRQKDKEKYDENWEKLKEKYDGSTAQTKIPTPSKPFPNVKIRDKSTPTQPPTP